MATGVVDIAEEIGIIEKDADYTTLVKDVGFLPENAIPIPPSYGKLVEERFKACVDFYSRYHKEWKETITQFNDTGAYNDNAPNEAPKENFIRQNVSVLLEQTYMRNPTPEFTRTTPTEDEQEQQFIDTLSAIITRLSGMRYSPGLNMKAVAQAQLVRAHLTNWGVVKLCFTEYRSSREAKMSTYYSAEKLLREANDLDQVRDKYAALQRLYEEAMSSASFGMKLKVLSPFSFMVDIASQREDLEDADYTFEIEAMDIGRLKFNYSIENEEGQQVFRYNNNRPFSTEAKYSSAVDGFKEKLMQEIMPEASAEENKVLEDKRVPCVWVYDRILRKTILYLMGQWDTPLWVFEDELGLSRYYPYFLMTFSPTVAGLPRRGEPTYYLAQQKEINDDTALFTMIKRSASSLIVYDTEAIDKAEVDKVLTEALRPSSRMRSVGVKLRGGEKTLDQVLAPFRFPVSQLAELFNNDRHRATISTTSRISPSTRGQEFKTNTTNLAVQSYQQGEVLKLSSMVDAIEETMSQLYHAITEVVVSKFSAEQITELVGPEYAMKFTPMSVKEFNKQYQIEIEGGSTEKPTSENKKKEAFTIIQLLGQFGKAAPVTVLTVVSKLLRLAVSKTLVSDKDLETLKQEGTAAMQKGISTPTGAMNNGQ